MRYILVLAVCSILLACGNDKSPKKRGYYRIDFPEKEYNLYEDDCPYKLYIPTYASIDNLDSSRNPGCWKNIDFPGFNGKIHASYLEIEDSLSKYTEDSRSFVVNHISMADGITEEMISIPEKKIYGMLYNIEGNTASSVQFYMTDSTNHFFRGALYFNTTPNIDSIAPVLDFIKDDIAYLIEHFEWK